MRAATQADRRRLLAFTTGSACAPVRGLGSLAITLVRGSGGLEELPTSHTCFNNLCLPEYRSAAVLGAKLRTALAHAEGFGFV